MAGKSAATIALLVGNRWHFGTWTYDDTFAIADTNLRVPMPRDPVWTTVAAVESASRIRGVPTDPNSVPLMAAGVALPLVVDPDSGRAFTTNLNEDGTIGTIRNGIPHACGIGFASMLERHPNVRSLPAETKALWLSLHNHEA